MSRLSRWLPVLLVVALLGAAMLAALASDISVGRTPAPPPPPNVLPGPPGATSTPPPTTATLGGPAQPTYQLPSWVGTLLAIVCIGSVMVLVGAILWSVLRDSLTVRRSVPEVADPEELRRRSRERVRAALDEGLSDLDVADSDPRRAVIACWARLESAAAAAGTARQPGDTSTELVARLLADHAVSEAVLADFAELYRRARFATHAIDEVMRDHARAALRQIRDELLAETAS